MDGASEPGSSRERFPDLLDLCDGNWFSINEAARRLGLKSSTLYGLCAAGRIDHARHGLGRGTIRISEDALTAYLESVMVVSSAVAGPAGNRGAGRNGRKPRPSLSWREELRQRKDRF